MWSVQKIIVPTDFGKASEAAVDAAIEVAKKFEASIVIMHAYQIPAYAYPTAPVDLVADLTPHFKRAAGVERPGFQVLADEPPREVVVGAIGRVWEADIPFVHVVDAEAFAAFTELSGRRSHRGSSLDLDPRDRDRSRC